MAIAYHTPNNTYVVYGEESAYGTGTPLVANRVGRVTNVSLTMTNNFFKTQGLGEGRNATGAFTGPFDVSGSIDWDVDDFTFMQYAIGTKAGSTGLVADPFELQELDNIGYTATDIKSLSLEIGTEAGTTDDETTVAGVVLNNLTLTASQGEVLKASADFIGQTVATGTSVLSYTAPTDKVFVFQQGAVNVGSDELQCTSFALTIANNVQSYRALGSRLIQQPVTGIRRYDFTLTVRKKLDTTASTLSPLELRDLFFGAAAAPATAGSVTAYAVSLDIAEGSADDDRVVEIDLENCYFESWSEPIPLEGGYIEITVAGFGLAGLTDGSAHIPIRWWSLV